MEQLNKQYFLRIVIIQKWNNIYVTLIYLWEASSLEYLRKRYHCTAQELYNNTDRSSYLLK